MKSLPSALIKSARWLAALGVVALALTREPNPLFLAVFAALFLCSFKVQRMPRLAKVIGKLQPIFAVLSFIVGVLDFMYISSSFLLAVAHFLLLIQGLRMLALRTVRDVGGALLLASLMVLSASTLSMDWTFMAVVMLFLPVVIWTLILVTITSEAQIVSYEQSRQEIQSKTSEEEEKKRYAAVTAGLSEESFVDERNPVWVRMIPGLRIAALTAFVTAVSCCAFVFVAFPRFNFRGFRGHYLQPVHRTGFSNQVDLNKQAQIFQDNSVVMRIQISPKSRRFWPGYVRGSTLDQFDGRIWRKSSNEHSHTLSGVGGEVRLPYEKTKDDEILHQDIFLEAIDTPVLFAAPMPVSWKMDRPFLFAGIDGSFQRPPADTWRVHYEAYSLFSRTDPRRLVTRSYLSHAQQAQKLQEMTALPDDEETKRLKNFADTIGNAAKSSVTRAQELTEYLRKNYSYTLDFSAQSGKNPLSEFLFTTKKGNCEFFSSALCALLRAENIPSRVVTGFYSREWNSQGNYFVVRMRDAHAWVEAYVDNQWMMFDPSPRVFSDGDASWAARFQESMDYMNLRWNRYVLSYDFDRQAQLLEDANARSKNLTARLDQWGFEFGSWMGKIYFTHHAVDNSGRNVKRWTLPIFLIVVIFFAAVLLLNGFRKRRSTVWFYGALLRYLEERGAKKADAMTVQEAVESLKERLGPLWPDLEYLKSEYYRCRFSPSSTFSVEDRRRVRQALKRLGAV